ncbi:Flp pilus assembly protein CpaB [Luethyella okanaganae]|uniref:Flp pilus assembly protein CpaB n=1 Tax=Luethyella okanaganae TaxID=69372 RepID=A0ABW1VFI2_9MICO
MKTRLIGAILAIVLAVAGTVVLIGYVRGADARAAAGAELVPVYLVQKQVPGGTPAEELSAYLTTAELPASAAAQGRVIDLRDLAGLVADVELEPGEQLLASRWVDPAELAAQGDVAVPVGMQAVTIALPVEQVVGGTVKAGDTVGVVIAATIKPAGSGDEVSLTRQAFHRVLVLSVQPGTVVAPNTDGAKAPSDPVSALMITLARSTPDVETLVWGQQFGTIWLTLEPEGADESGSRSVDGSIVFP